MDQSTNPGFSKVAVETVEPPYLPVLGGDASGNTIVQVRQQAFNLFANFAKAYSFKIVTSDPADGVDQPSTYQTGASNTNTFLVLNTTNSKPYLYDPAGDVWVDLASAPLSDAQVETAYNNQVDAATLTEMENGLVADIRRMSPLNIAQAIAALAPTGAKTNTTTTDPTAANDVGEGYSVNSVWTNSTSDESFICVDNTLGVAVWKNITSIGPIDSDTLVEGSVQLLLTVGERNAISALGTAAQRDVPASGDAAVGEAVLGSDTRLTDARTPLAHTHTAADVDDVGAGYTGATIVDNSTLEEALQALETQAEAPAPGGGYTNVVIDTSSTTTYTVAAGEQVLVLTASAPSTISPPAAPVVGDRFHIVDATGGANVNNITIDFVTATQPLHSTVENAIIDTSRGSIVFEYIDGSIGWITLK